MFNHKRIVIQRFSTLVALSFFISSSAFAVESGVFSDRSLIDTPDFSVKPLAPINANLPTSHVDWSYLDAITVNSSRQLCPNSGSTVCFKMLAEQAYADNQFYPLWQNLVQRREFELQLKSVVDTGMVAGLKERLDELYTLDKYNDQRAYDLLATDSYFVYRTYLNTIQRNRTTLFTLDPVNFSVQPSSFGAPHYFPITMDKLTLTRPANIPFEQSMSVIERLQQLPPHRLTHSDLKGLIRKGDVIVAGKELAKVLFDLNDMTEAEYTFITQMPTITNSGTMLEAIKRFQRRNGLADDGIIGVATTAQLVMPYTDIARRVALNIQRFRNINVIDNQPHIWVNIPDYMLKIFDQGNVIFESKVIVGRTNRPTNLFSSAINTMVVNPTWNVPETIKRKDVIPKVKHSRDYLTAHNMRILNSWRDRTEIPADQIDWSSVNPKTFPHEFQQGPGPSNSLGRVKFLMPNDYSIYLHDTPARGLFNKSKRNLSSGCVRVEKAYDLASFIIDFQKRKNIEPFNAMLKDGDLDTVRLSQRLGVDFVYLTAWIDEKNTLQMREDIYGYDSPQKEAIDSQFISMKNYRR
ncbi:MAG: L,D-transpeptidase family protein [Photobacterium frigidiphilum]|uniref:L,D-transpeptidase family protein n=1 Tax=Photobacterium frigidiphilum TaxID=264736 RepID=UPI00300302DC